MTSPTKNGDWRTFVSGTLDDPATLENPSDPEAKLFKEFKPFVARYFLFRADTFYGEGAAIHYISLK